MGKPPPTPDANDYQQALKSMGSFIDINLDDLMVISSRAKQFAQQRTIASANIAGLMAQPVITVPPHTPLVEAARLLVSKRIGCLPVVDDGGLLVGIMTESDFLRILGVPAPPPRHNLWRTVENLFRHWVSSNGQEPPSGLVAKHMTSHVITASPVDNAQTVLDLMGRHHVRRVVIVDGTRHVCGIVTRSNLVGLFFDTNLYKETAPSGL